MTCKLNDIYSGCSFYTHLKFDLRTIDKTQGGCHAG